MERTEILSKLSLAAHALAKQSETILPILKSMRFKNGKVMAYDDVIAIELPIDFKIDGVLSGHQLIKFLSQCDSKEVMVNGDDKNVTVTCKRAKLKLPVTSVKDWPFTLPKKYIGKEITGIKVGDTFFNALRMVSAPVKDQGLASWLGGVNFYFKKARLEMYGINAARTAVCYTKIKMSTKAKELSGRFIVPANFCKSSLALAKEFGEDARLFVSSDFMILLWPEDKVLCFTKLIDPDGPDVQSVTFSAVQAAENYVRISPSMLASFKRAASLGLDGTCAVKINAGKLIFKTEADYNALLNDSIKLSDKHPDVEFVVPSDTLVRMLDHCTEIAFMESQVVARSEDGGFYYIVANRVQEAVEE